MHDDGPRPPAAPPHIPVLLAEVLAALHPRAGGLYIDGTFGAGGYSRAILDAADCRVIAIDRDPVALAAGRPLVAAYGGRLVLVPGEFGTLDRTIRAAAPDRFGGGHGTGADGVVLDIGVSSMQLDTPERGFSFMHDGPLDMRMAQTGAHAGPSAADVVNTAEADELADIIFHLGEERAARRIARAIVARRAEKPILRTRELADLVQRVLKTPKIDGRHAATRTFQALRIHVNDELGELERGLVAAERTLAPGGRLAVVTFHSLEDRIAKSFLRTRSGRLPQGSRHSPAIASATSPPTFELTAPKPIEAGPEECARNPRARSARLRWAVRTAAAPWPGVGAV